MFRVLLPGDLRVECDRAEEVFDLAGLHYRLALPPAPIVEEQALVEDQPIVEDPAKAPRRARRRRVEDAPTTTTIAGRPPNPMTTERRAFVRQELGKAEGGLTVKQLADRRAKVEHIRAEDLITPLRSIVYGLQKDKAVTRIGTVWHATERGE